MLDHATGYCDDDIPGRFIIETARGIDRWEVIVEPQAPQRVLLVVTAYKLA